MRRGLGVVLLSGVGGNSILMKGRTAACLGERASDIRVAGRTGRSCAPTVVHITRIHVQAVRLDRFRTIQELH